MLFDVSRSSPGFLLGGGPSGLNCKMRSVQILKKLKKEKSLIYDKGATWNNI